MRPLVLNSATRVPRQTSDITQKFHFTYTRHLAPLFRPAKFPAAHGLPPLVGEVPRVSDVEDDGGDLAVLHGGAVVVARRVRELEYHLLPVVAVYCHSPETLRAVV